MTVKVSIVIPFRNAAPWLAETIRSCLDQTWPATEIIAVDNGSDDDSLAIARGFGDAIRVLACERPGAGAARNTGLHHAAGVFIQFLDADDILAPDKISRQMARLADAPGESIASGAWARFRDDPAEARFFGEPVWRDLAPEEFLISSWLGGGMMANFAWLAPRAVVDAAGSWDETLSLNDDGEFFTRVVLASSGIVFCGEARGYYRTGAGPTLSARRDPAALASAYRATEASCARLLAYRDSVEARRACAAQFQRFVHAAFPAVPELVARAESHIAALGGSGLDIGGGPAFRALSRCLGWKAARRCQLGWQLSWRALTGHAA